VRKKFRYVEAFLRRNEKKKGKTEGRQKHLTEKRGKGEIWLVLVGKPCGGRGMGKKTGQTLLLTQKKEGEQIR
jgi:hypothetical protein